MAIFEAFLKTILSNRRQIVPLRFLYIEILFDQLLALGLWNTGRSSDKYNFIDIFLLHNSIFHHLLDRFHGWTEKIHVELFELGPGQFGFLFIEILFDQLLNLWYTRRSSDKCNFIDILIFFLVKIVTSMPLKENIFYYCFF